MVFLKETVTAAEAIKIVIDERFEEKAGFIEIQMNELASKLPQWIKGGG
jgi:hypothetical protein